MNYKRFKNSVYTNVVGSDIKDQIPYYGSTITETIDGYVFIDSDLTEFVSLEEAREHLKQQQVQQDIQNKIQEELYEEMSDNKIADIIRDHHGNIKITDTLIESYVELASSKLFTLDPVAYNMAQFNKFDKIAEGRIDYKLNDGTSVVITEETYQRINNIFGKYPDVIEHMRESVDNFLNVVDQIED
jgi:hypothetical protein